MSYDRAITVFSPDGHLFQVEYAVEAVNQGSSAVGVRGKDCVVIGVEVKSTGKLQETRTVRKIFQLDDNLVLAFAGLTADGRVLINKVRLEIQNYRLSMEESCSTEYVARHLARVQQKFTQTGGRRPFGISTLVVGFNPDGSPQLYMTDPAGSYSAWKANAIGRSDKTVREYLEKHYEAESQTEESTVRLTAKALLEIVESGAKNMELAICRPGRPMQLLSSAEVEAIVKSIEEEREAAKAKLEKKQ